MEVITGPTEYSDNKRWNLRGFFGYELFGEKGYELPNTFVHASKYRELMRDLRVLGRHGLIDPRTIFQERYIITNSE